MFHSSAYNLTFRRHSGGFGLVEIMVGLVIGLLGVIVMMQVLAMSEKQRRTGQGGNDAQSNGAIALYDLQRDMRQAGYGISAPALIGCNVQLPSGVTLNAMAPVTINHASIPNGDTNTDTLLVVYGTNNGATEGDNITAQPATATGAVAPDIYAVAVPTSFNVGERVIAQANTSTPRAGACNLQMTTVAAVGLPTGNANNVVVPAGTGAAGMSGGVLYNLGVTPRIVAYAVRGGNLTRCDMMANNCTATSSLGDTSVWVPISSNIVSLRAEYGRDTATAVVSAVPNPTPSYQVSQYDQTTPVTDCGWIRTLAVRLVLVARSTQIDAAVNSEAPDWLGSASTPIDLSAETGWQNYRYKTFQTVVPIRNVTWTGVQAGC